jgi:dihydrofolate synthase / folylpolyglutamate synthase
VASPDMSAELADVEQALRARWPESHVAPDLSRIRMLTDLMGEPQKAYPVIHVTGTNGKTSTARMIEALLMAFGLRPGTFTSPHLHSPLERIRLLGQSVTPDRFVELHADVAPLISMVDDSSTASGGPAMTYFEVMTGLAFAAFADAPVDVAVIEVGVGGEWDCTNVADGQVAVITPIDMDHQDLLGDTIEEIARTKAGIIKDAATVVMAGQQPDAAHALLQRCQERGARPVRQGVEFGLVDRRVAVGGQLLTLQGLGGRYEDILLPLFGEHQAHNAAMALAAVEAFLGGGAGPLDIDAVREGFMSVTSPGRIEIVRSSPTVIIDAAHNPHGAASLAATLGESFNFTRVIGVVACFEDKDSAGILEALEPVMDEVVITRNSSPRSHDVDDLAEIAREHFGDERVHTAETLHEAVDMAVSLADQDEGQRGGAGVIATGSVVTAADVRSMFVSSTAVTMAGGAG